jgi:hypothetical protein
MIIPIPEPAQPVTTPNGLASATAAAVLLTGIVLLVVGLVPNRQAGLRRLGWITRFAPWDGVILSSSVMLLWGFLYLVGAALLVWLRHDYSAWENVPWMGVRIASLSSVPLVLTVRVLLGKRRDARRG